MIRDPAEAEAATHTHAARAAAPATLDGMLALQEAGAREVQDRQARRHGQAITAVLARLQRALLGGGQAESDCLHELEALVKVVPDASDPALRRIVREAATRACVELARRGLTPGSG